MQKTWTEQEIVNLLRTNDYFVWACLSQMLKRQTSAEVQSYSTRDRNGRGYSANDAKFMTSLGLQVRKYKHLSPKQTAYARKILYKYRRQLVEIANENEARK